MALTYRLVAGKPATVQGIQSILTNKLKLHEMSGHWSSTDGIGSKVTLWVDDCTDSPYAEIVREAVGIEAQVRISFRLSMHSPLLPQDIYVLSVVDAAMGAFPPADIAFLFNADLLLLKRLGEKLELNINERTADFWTVERLSAISLPYTLVPFPVTVI